MQQWYGLNETLPAECGAKACNLSKLIKTGLNVPAGSVIIHSAPIDLVLIRQAIGTLRFPLIVRSSANVEDSGLTSLAGVFASYAASNETEVLEAIQKIRDHSVAAPVQKLLAQYNIAPQSVHISYLIQEHQPSERGGVMIIPADRTKPVTVEAGSSPDEVTAGRSTPHTYRVKLNDRATLPEEWLTGLREAARSIGSEFEGAQDVEWLQTPQGTIYILQARPYLEKPALEAVVAAEQLRLERLSLHPGTYTTDSLPDIDAPTPLTLSLLQRVYAGGVQKRYGLRKKVDGAHVFPVIAGQLYCDTAELKALLTLPGRTRYMFRRLDLLFNLRRHTFMPSGRKNKRSASSITALYDRIEELGRELFQISDQLEIVRRQLQKKLAITKESLLLTDLSQSPLRRAAFRLNDNQLAERFGYLGGNEYELSAPRFAETGHKGVAALRKLAKTPGDRSDVVRRRAQAVADYISIFDVAYRKNLFKIYDTLYQERANIHDDLIRVIAELRKRLIAQDEAHRLGNTIWYADTDEVLEDNLPAAEVLRTRKDSWQILQNLPYPPVNDIRDWKEFVPVKPPDSQNSYDGTELSPGYAQGKVIIGLPSSPAGQKYILVTTSLSHEIIIKKDGLAGVITERGGAFSHVSLLAREHNLPVLRISGATKLFHEGENVTVDTKAQTAVRT